MGDTFSRIEKQGLENVHVVRMNAEHIGFPDASFDLALCGFVGWDYCFDFYLGEFIAPDTRLAEIRRALRDGGRVGFSLWECQQDIEWLAQTFLRHFPSLAPEPDEHGIRREVVYSKENAEGYHTLLSSAGFGDIRIVTETAGFVCAGKEQWWEQMRHVGWDEPLETVKSLGPDRLQAFKEAVFRDLDPFQQAEGIHFTKTVSFVFATKQGNGP